MITVTQARENDRTTFVRQFTFNKNGYSNRETAGAIVSGMPVAGMPISELPVGSKIALTDPAKLSPNEVGYIVVQQNEDTAYLTTDAHQVTGNWTNRDTTAQQFIADMTDRAQAVCTLVRGAMERWELSAEVWPTGKQALTYFAGLTHEATPKREFWSDYWTNTRSTMTNLSYSYIRKNGMCANNDASAPNKIHALRPLLSIPSSTLVSSQPNAAGAYELV